MIKLQSDTVLMRYQAQFTFRHTLSVLLHCSIIYTCIEKSVIYQVYLAISAYFFAVET